MFYFLSTLPQPSLLTHNATVHLYKLPLTHLVANGGPRDGEPRESVNESLDRDVSPQHVSRVVGDVSPHPLFLYLIFFYGRNKIDGRFL